MSPAEHDLPHRVTDLPTLPERPLTMHKGQAGHVAVVAGSRGMSGAAVLTGLGALRGGAGLVRIYCPDSTQPVIASAEPCFMTVPGGEDSHGEFNPQQLAEVLDDAWPAAVALGPGLGRSGGGPATATWLCTRADPLQRPLVIDADGLNALALLKPNDAWSPRRALPTIVTPHPGEMARLRLAAGLPDARGDDDETRIRMAHEFAQLSGTVVVLKGHRTVVADGARAYVNSTGNPGMATGGMGDVLTGLIAALLAQGLPAFDAARLAVHVHGLAADYCARDIGPVGYLARDVAETLPAALTRAQQRRIGFGESAAR